MPLIKGTDTTHIAVYYDGRIVKLSYSTALHSCVICMV